MSVTQAALSCPSCGGELEERDERLLCRSCSETYPVVRGIPRFVGRPDGGLGQIQDAFDFEHRRYRDSAYTRFGRELVGQFLDECGLPADFFRELEALDAGCGSGRWAYALAELGASVTAFDLTAGGVEVAQAELHDRPNVRLLQADLFALPFRDESFDFVTSWGVLHHTPSTRAAFDKLVPLVRRGGTMYVMVYERGTRLRQVGTNALRFLLRRVSAERRYALCRRLIIRNRYLLWALSRMALVADMNSGLDEKTMQFGLYDAYSPRYNHLHTASEVETWFEASGFEDVVVVSSGLGAVRVRGRRR